MQEANTNGPVRPVRRYAAAALMALQAVVLAGLGVILAVRTALGHESQAGRATTLVLLVVVFALGAAAIARGLLLGRAAARTPVVLWNAFVVLTGVTLLRGGAPGIGVTVLLLGGFTLVLGILAELDPGDPDRVT